MLANFSVQKLVEIKSKHVSRDFNLTFLSDDEGYFIGITRVNIVLYDSFRSIMGPFLRFAVHETL